MNIIESRPEFCDSVSVQRNAVCFSFLQFERNLFFTSGNCFVGHGNYRRHDHLQLTDLAELHCSAISISRICAP